MVILVIILFIVKKGSTKKVDENSEVSNDGEKEVGDFFGEGPQYRDMDYNKSYPSLEQSQEFKRNDTPQNRGIIEQDVFGDFSLPNQGNSLDNPTEENDPELEKEE